MKIEIVLVFVRGWGFDLQNGKFPHVTQSSPLNFFGQLLKFDQQLFVIGLPEIVNVETM